MSSFGVTEEGFVEKTLEDILDEIEDEQKAAFGPAFDVSADGPAGQLNGVFADEIAQLWEVANAIYRSLYPDSASGEALDNVAAITGATRLAPTKTKVTLSLNLDSGTTVPAGSTVEISATGDRFDTLDDVTNSGSDPANVSSSAEAQESGPISANAGAIDTIVTPVSGWTAQASVDTSNSETYDFTGGGQTLTVRVDGGSAQTVTFLVGDFVTPSLATAAEIASRIDTDLAGASAVDAGGIVRIESDTDGPGSSLEVTGGTANSELGFPTDLKAGINPEGDEDTLGTDLETDSGFRLRRESLIRVQGSATLESIRADLLDVDGVLEAFVFQNDTASTDSDGLPPKSVEAVVDAPGVTDLDIATALFNSVAAGIETFGTTADVPVVDSQGFTQEISFSRSDDVLIYAEISVVTNSNPKEGPIYPSDGDVQLKAALVEKGNALGIGDNVIYEPLKCAAFDVPGVIDIISFAVEGVFTTSTSGSAETYSLSDGQTLLVKVDEESVPQTATFNTGDFVSISAATAAEVAAVVTADISGATAADVGGNVVITSTSGGTIEVTGGTANTELGFPTPGTPTGTSNITIKPREQAQFDTTRISIV